MRLASSGREYANVPVNVPASDGIEFTFDGGATWHPAERPSDEVARVLVAGPENTDGPPDTVQLALGTNPVAVRLTDNPEVVIRLSGSIYVFLLPT